MNTSFEYQRSSFSIDLCGSSETSQSRLLGFLERNMSDTCVVLCDLESEDILDRAMFIPTRLSDLGVSYDSYHITDENESSVSIEADSFTPFVMLDLPYLLSDNCFTLKVGERKTVRKIKKL